MSVNALGGYQFTLNQNVQNSIASTMSNFSANTSAFTSPYTFGTGSTTSTSSSTGSSSTSATSINESYEDYMKRLEKEKKQKAEKEKKAKELAEKKAEFEKKQLDTTSITQALGVSIENTTTQKGTDGTKTTTASVTDIEKALKKQQKQLDKATTQENGNIVLDESLEEYRKKTPWWKRTLRSGASMLQGAWKLMTNFAGYEDGKMNWKKTLKNLGIAAVALAACAIPGVGPVISTTLIASGVVFGGIGIGKGISKAVQAETVNEMDNAFQDIGAGTAIFASSCAGLKGIGKTFRTPNLPAPATGATGGATAGATAGATGGATAGATAGATGGATAGATAGATRGARINKFIGDAFTNLLNKFKPSNMKQGLTDMTVNAFKGTVENTKASNAAIKANGFFKTFGSNLKNQYLSPAKDLATNTGSKIKGKFEKLTHPNIDWSWKLIYKAPWSLIKTTFKTAWWAMGVPFKPWNYVSKTPAGAEFRIQQVVNPQYEAGWFAKQISKDEAETQKEQIAQYLDEIQKQRDAVKA